MLKITSSAFENGADIPKRFTCKGNDASPPLSWEGIPENTRSLVLIVDDPDAPDPAAPKMVWAHWIMYNIPPETEGLAENIPSAKLPAGTIEGINDWRRPGYGGPCPPIGRHRYFYKLYALDTVLKKLDYPNKAMVEDAMHGHIIAQAELVGTFKK